MPDAKSICYNRCMIVDLTTPSVLPLIDRKLIAGIDVGGTKVHIADTKSTVVKRYSTTEFASLDEVLAKYFQEISARPSRIMVGMAGPRDDETGAIKLTNLDWPAFDPRAATKRYGVIFSTANDMVITMAGALHETGINLHQLKAGTVATTGTKLVVTLSTGVGTATAVWDEMTERYVIAAGEGGHIGFQPKTDHEQQYAAHLHSKYPHASLELALSGKHGIDNLIEHLLNPTKTRDLAQSIERAQKAHRPVGAVLLEYATEGTGIDKQAAQFILQLMGDILGSALRDLAVSCKATGGIYLTGSVALGLGEYLAENTDFQSRFICEGATHDTWLAKTPIYLLTDPNIAVQGALALAKDLKSEIQESHTNPIAA